MPWCLKKFCAVGALCMFSYFLVKVTEWPPIGKIAAHSAKYLIVSLVFSHLGFWSGNLFLIAPFPVLCLLVPFSGPSSAFEKWSGHERSKLAFTSAEGTSRGSARERAFPPLVKGVWGISFEKILYFRTSVETILMHFETIFET